MDLQPNADDTLLKPIDELGTSPEFIKKSQELGFSNLKEITSKGWGELQRLPGFEYGWFNELVKLLEYYQLLQLLEDLPDGK